MNSFLHKRTWGGKTRALTVSMSVVLMFAAASMATAMQTDGLQQKLLGEDAQALVEAARTDGDPIRGAIVFNNKKQACTSCHSIGANDLLGPDLSALGDETSEAQLVQALLDPSAKIRKGFEQVSVLTVDGLVHVGRVIENGSDAITLRLVSDPAKLVVLDRKGVEAIKPSEKSAMPDDLVDQLTDRDQFLDLLSYLMQLRDAGEKESNAVVSTMSTTRELEPSLERHVLFTKYQCNQCHRELQQDTGLPISSAPKLEWALGRISPEFIEKFIQDPTALHAGTVMPNLFAQTEASKRSLIAAQLTHFIMSLGSESVTRELPDPKIDDLVAPASAVPSAERGRQLFETVGCVACHAPQDESGIEQELPDSRSLAHVPDKYTRKGLTDFLEDPHVVRPHGRMPNLQLTHWEAIDLAAYLLRNQKKSTAVFQLNTQWVAEGSKHFSTYGCNQCHAMPGVEPTELALEPARFDSSTGCLSETNGSWPRFTFAPGELELLRSTNSDALAQRIALEPDQRIKLSMAHFNCIACHERDGWGGVTLERNALFHTENPNIGPQGRIPPRLTGVGAKLNRKWLRQVLVSGKSIRPYMKTRMPIFGSDNVAHLAKLFHETDTLPPVDSPTIQDEKLMRNAGFDMVSRDGLNCIACHNFQMKPADTMPAADLTEMTERLRKDWFVHYMRSPQQLSPRTVMPTFWPGGKALRKDILDGDADLQIEALWQYLLDGRQAREPRGVRRERLELLAGDEAVMLRRSWPTVGKRGIGVGYPSQVNQVYDAEQMRVAMVWRGRFADPGGVWRSQGHGVAHPLEREQFQFAKGPDLDDANNPWVVDEGRPQNHQFKGYELDDLRRPAFHYQFEKIDVYDRMVDIQDAQSGDLLLKRMLSMHCDAPREGVSWRIASGKQIVEVGRGVFLVDNKLYVSVVPAAAIQIYNYAEGQELRWLLDVVAGQTEIAAEYRWKGNNP